MVSENDQLRHRAHADAIIARAGSQLGELLQELAAGIDPFPEFPGSFFSYGIEVEPLPGDSERGCVVLGEDGALYELQIGGEVGQLDTDDPATGRSEVRLPLEDLDAASYLHYAYRAVEAALAHLERQGYRLGSSFTAVGSRRRGGPHRSRIARRARVPASRT